MWYLINKTNGKKYFLLCNKLFKIGRTPAAKSTSDLDIEIEGDPTVSRNHADIIIKYDVNDEITNIVVTDNSKFGTFVNDKKVNSYQVLKANDKIKFGANTSVFDLINEPLIVTTSCLTPANKSKVKQIINRLGGSMLNDWRNDCSYVIMDSITVTVKVIDALICQKRIVSKKYFEDLVQSVETKTKLPNPEEYLPSLHEADIDPQLVSFEPLPIRKTLFTDKIFVFFTDLQLKKMQNIIELASGECELFDPITHLNKKFLKRIIDSFIFILTTDKSKEALSNQQKLKSSISEFDRKLVDESEIGLAILYGSLDKYCNTLSSQNQVDKEKNHPIAKLASQTLVDTCINRAEYDPSQIIMEEPTSDSVMLQFEGRIHDMVMVADTQPLGANNENSNKDTQINRSISNKLNDFDLLKEEFDFRPDSVTIKEEVFMVEDEEPCFKEPSPAKKLKVNNHQNLLNESKKITNSLPNKIKEENKVMNNFPSASLPFKVKKNDKDSKPNIKFESGFIYSKSKPPPDSIIVKSENTDTQPTPSINVKVKFAPLVKQEATFYSDSIKTTNGKANFKKFHKIPKKLHNPKSEQEESSSLFKSFKQEEFDVNTQFELYMQSMR